MSLFDTPCFGCTHSAKITEEGKTKSVPSGERPCVICSRNWRFEERKASIKANNGTEIFAPKDMYISLDRLVLEVSRKHTHHPWINFEKEEEEV